jgi:hypothetical protein
MSGFVDDLLDQVTIYVLIGKADSQAPVRYFIAKNREIVGAIHRPSGWDNSGFVSMKTVEPFEGQWQALLD